MTHDDAREGKWRGNWRMEWVASTLHTTSEHGVSSITTADAHTSAASSRLIWRPRRFKWTRPFRRKTKSGFCACAITFQLASNTKEQNIAVQNVATWRRRLTSYSYMNPKEQPHTHTHTHTHTHIKLSKYFYGLRICTQLNKSQSIRQNFHASRTFTILLVHMTSRFPRR